MKQKLLFGLLTSVAFFIGGRLIFAALFLPKVFRSRPDLLLNSNPAHFSFLGGVWSAFFFLKLMKMAEDRRQIFYGFLLSNHIFYSTYLYATNDFFGQKYWGYPAAYWLVMPGFLISLLLFFKEVTDY